MDKLLRPPPRSPTMRSSPPPRTLLLIAFIAVLSLAALSDSKTREAAGLAAVDGDDRSVVSVIVVQWRPCNGGHLLNITDGEGGWATAFCSLDVLPSPPVNGTSMRLVVERSSSDPAFLYVQSLSIIAAPTGND